MSLSSTRATHITRYRLQRTFGNICAGSKEFLLAFETEGVQDSEEQESWEYTFTDRAGNKWTTEVKLGEGVHTVRFDSADACIVHVGAKKVERE